MKEVVMIFVGSGIGGVARYLSVKAVAQLWPVSFPAGTLAVNATAAILIGMLAGIVHHRQLLPVSAQFLLITGFCGGFSTFSAFSLESLRLLQSGQYLLFTAYIVLSVVLCIGFTWLGWQIVR